MRRKKPVEDQVDAKKAPRRTPKQARATVTRDIVLVAIERVLAKHGARGTTTTRVAQAAGISIGTVYHYFPTKEALLAAWEESKWEETLALLAERAATLDVGDFEASAEALARVVVDRMLAVFAMYRSTPGELLLASRTASRLQLAGRAAAVVRALVEANRPRCRDVDPHVASLVAVNAALLLSMVAVAEHGALVESGAFAHELSRMLVRYLVEPSRRGAAAPASRRADG